MRILVIDDDPTVGEVIAETLSGDVVAVELDSASGIARFASAEVEEQPFDLVLCSNTMYGMTGHDVYAAVHAHREPPMFVMMASPDEAIDTHDADAFLAKPFRLRELIEAIEQIRSMRAHAKTCACPTFRQLGIS